MDRAPIAPARNQLAANFISLMACKSMIAPQTLLVA